MSSPPSYNDVEIPKKRSYNFLQRNHTTKHHEQPNFVYLQAEFLRLTVDLVHKFNFNDELKEYLYLLDRGETIRLTDISNPNIRKKMRHLLRALYVEEKNGYYTKPSDCDISLRHLLDEFGEYIEDKCRNLPKPKERNKYTVKDTKNDQTVPESTLNGGNDDPIITATTGAADDEGTDIKTSLKSLRELHEEGFYVDYKEMQKEFIKKHKAIDLWGLSAEEQLLAMNDQAQHAHAIYGEDEGYVIGSAVKSILGDTIRQVNNKEYKELIGRGNELRQNFS